MTRSKKTLAVLLAIIAMLSVFNGGIMAFADNTESDENPMRYSVIDSYTSGISISGITAECHAALAASYSTSLKIKMELQKKKSGVYETIKTWTDTKTGSSMAAGHSRAINVLSTYRLKTTFTAGGESAVVYSYP